MPYDQELLDRVRLIVKRKRSVVESKMFGGVALMVDGNMACAIRNDELFVRLGNAGAEAALEEEHVRVMDVTGRPMKSYVTVSAQGIANDSDLRRWIERGIAYARTLPKKP